MNWKIHVYLPNLQCLLAGLYFRSIDVFIYVYLPDLLCIYFPVHIFVHWKFFRQLAFFLHLFDGFNMYRLYVFIFQFIFLCYQYYFLTICCNYPVRWSRGVRGVASCGGLQVRMLEGANFFSSHDYFSSHNYYYEWNRLEYNRI